MRRQTNGYDNAHSVDSEWVLYNVQRVRAGLIGIECMYSYDKACNLVHDDEFRPWACTRAVLNVIHVHSDIALLLMDHTTSIRLSASSCRFIIK